MSAFLYLLQGVLAVFGRLAGHILGARRDLDGKRRELRVQFLVDAWRNVERAANRPGRRETRALEHALADIQLFGTASEADQAARVARSMNGSGNDPTALDDLLEALRVDLRAEMRLGSANGRLVYLRDGHAITSSSVRYAGRA
jgi:hypothetical protein